MKELFFRLFLSGLFLIAPHFVAHGQSSKYFGLSVANESVSFPFTRFTQLNPGLEVSYSHLLNEQKGSDRFLLVSAGFYHHPYLANGVYLKAAYHLKKKLVGRFYGDLLCSAGYLHTFYPSTIYYLEEGAYTPERQIGRPHALGGLGAGITYKGIGRAEPFIRYEFMLEAPFANGIPVFPHSFYRMGINFKID